MPWLSVPEWQIPLTEWRDSRWQFARITIDCEPFSLYMILHGNDLLADPLDSSLLNYWQSKAERSSSSCPRFVVYRLTLSVSAD